MVSLPLMPDLSVKMLQQYLSMLNHTLKCTTEPSNDKDNEPLKWSAGNCETSLLKVFKWQQNKKLSGMMQLEMILPLGK